VDNINSWLARLPVFLRLEVAEGRFLILILHLQHIIALHVFGQGEDFLLFAAFEVSFEVLGEVVSPIGSLLAFCHLFKLTL
jgi:hypothetical protein